MDQRANMEDLLIKYLTGSASAEERETARKWINTESANRKYFEELKNYYQISALAKKPSGFDNPLAWERVRSNYYNKKYLLKDEAEIKIRRRLIYRIVSISAVAVFISFLLGGYINNQLQIKKSQANNYNEIIVPLGAKSQITLADGTKVWLNAGSKLNYPINFLSDKREVYLEGEAFFDVTHNKKKLFVVKTSSIVIKVFGTQFNVKSYPEENLIKTTLVEGSIAMETSEKGGGKKLIYLKPNQSVTFYKSSLETVTTDIEGKDSSLNNQLISNIEIEPKVDPLPITSWKDQKWIIAGEELGELSVQLERRYNVKISFESATLKKYKFSGTLTNETFEQVVKIIQLSAPIQYSIEGNKVVLKDDPKYKKHYDRMISNSILHNRPMENKN